MNTFKQSKSEIKAIEHLLATHVRFQTVKDSDLTQLTSRIRVPSSNLTILVVASPTIQISILINDMSKIIPN